MSEVRFSAIYSQLQVMAGEAESINDRLISVEGQVGQKFRDDYEALAALTDTIADKLNEAYDLMERTSLNNCTYVVEG